MGQACKAGQRMGLECCWCSSRDHQIPRYYCVHCVYYTVQCYSRLLTTG